MNPGDVVWLFSPVAGKDKYQIYLGTTPFGLEAFLFLNSKNRYPAVDCCFRNTDFVMLPPSDTGLSVVSLSMLSRYRPDELERMGPPEVKGQLTKDVVSTLLAAAKVGRALNGVEKRFVVECLVAIEARFNNP